MSELNNYTESLREANEINRNLLKKLVETENKLKQYESGFKGACPTCEIVGELNIELEQKLAEQSELLAKAVDGLKSIHKQILKESANT